MKNSYDYAIIGGGIIGLAAAFRLRQLNSQARIVLLEKEAAVARHQSGHNSGVIHAGVYYPPASLKAKYCRLGSQATLEFCAEHGVPARRCGKIIVAVDEAQTVRLRALAERSRQNGLAGQWLSAKELAEREPNVRGDAALFIPETGIADYPALCQKLADLASSSGTELKFNAEVTAIEESAAGVEVRTIEHRYQAEKLLVCAGLQADRLATMAGLEHDYAVVPFRGDYYRLPAQRSGLISSLIYPVPDPRLPFLGIHLTLDTAGGLTLGPSAMLAFSREDYRKWAANLRDFKAVVGYAGTWRLLARFPRAGLSELANASSRRRYLKAARQYCEGLNLGDLQQASCGIRAQLVNRAGELVHDFAFSQTARALHVLNAPSPAATSAFPIAEAIVDKLVGASGISPKQS